MTRLPVLFLSHGAPTYALEPGTAGQQLAKLALLLPTPEAVLVVSPHWATANVAVTTAANPATIHDFGGFPAALYEIEYPARGHPRLAQRTIDVLTSAGWTASANPNRGLDHGVWVPMLHMWRNAEVPVFQVSMPHDLDESAAMRLGQTLAPLSREGVLIVGSGSLTHNLFEFRAKANQIPSYVSEFTHWVRDAVVSGHTTRLISAVNTAPHGHRAHPTLEHYLPLLIAAGAAGASRATVLDGGIHHGVLAMESYLFEPIAASEPLELAA
jgi:4,5-DOPA dioxygenase extradiol